MEINEAKAMIEACKPFIGQDLYSKNASDQILGVMNFLGIDERLNEENFEGDPVGWLKEETGSPFRGPSFRFTYLLQNNFGFIRSSYYT